MSRQVGLWLPDAGEDGLGRRQGPGHERERPHQQHRREAQDRQQGHWSHKGHDRQLARKLDRIRLDPGVAGRQRGRHARDGSFHTSILFCRARSHPWTPLPPQEVSEKQAGQQLRQGQPERDPRYQTIEQKPQRHKHTKRSSVRGYSSSSSSIIIIIRSVAARRSQLNRASQGPARRRWSANGHCPQHQRARLLCPAHGSPQEVCRWNPHRSPIAQAQALGR
ncbi:hypothetical protein BC831DRAFT_439756 [Entophlyctis helioformis]|nr:hypothetical protein BC831DRAFT_439756 [Entophlyctis helioformis]